MLTIESLQQLQVELPEAHIPRAPLVVQGPTSTTDITGDNY